MKKRAVCPGCEFILARCLCHTLKPINNKTQIIILQHPSETGHALNTVNLMRKSLLNLKIFTDENFSDHQELNSIIMANRETIGLIYPAQEHEILNSNFEKKMSHIILIDGTWKKALKIFKLSLNLHTLPTFALAPTKPSNYKIRTSKFEHTLSTLEASLCALDILENELETNSLEASFLAMIEFQIEKMGEDTFKRNYHK